MKNKSTLVMIEHIVMLLVFVLAATVCVRMFVLSEKLSRTYEATDRAVLVAQNMAELLKCGGLTEFAEETGAVQTGENLWMVCYDKEWKGTEKSSAEFAAEVTCTESGGLFHGEVVISTAAGEELFRLPVAWQANIGGGDSV